ncbi:copper resistance protein B [Marinomonas flavescens]|uniref:copper resistance protein B n=1 Tax=Marinomonas flavescens TaxID=2529379 RepID=UPI001054CC23|nr:copper resistance protein B [Marinomonas flavescens]
MKNFKSPIHTLALVATAFGSSFVYAEAQDDPLLTSVMIDQLEKGVQSGDATRVSAQAWLGYDLNKLWLKVDSEYTNSDEQDLEIQALYSHAIAPYWNVQMGVRQDTKPTPTRHWAVLGVQGLAPYFFDIDAALFVGEEGRTALRLSVEQDWLITQRLILTPEFEINAYSKKDETINIGSGLSDISAGLRLRYEITRKFAPYIGLDWSQKLGNTADLVRSDGESTGDTQFVVGVKAWF